MPLDTLAMSWVEYLDALVRVVQLYVMLIGELPHRMMNLRSSSMGIWLI